MLMRVIGIRPKMIVSVDVRDRMGVDVAAVEMREGVLAPVLRRAVTRPARLPFFRL